MSVADRHRLNRARTGIRAAYGRTTSSRVLPVVALWQLDDIHLVWGGRPRHGRNRFVEADAADMTPLVGMPLPDGQGLYVESRTVGVVIEPTAQAFARGGAERPLQPTRAGSPPPRVPTPRRLPERPGTAHRLPPLQHEGRP